MTTQKVVIHITSWARPEGALQEFYRTPVGKALQSIGYRVWCLDEVGTADHEGQRYKVTFVPPENLPSVKHLPS